MNHPVFLQRSKPQGPWRAEQGAHAVGGDQKDGLTPQPLPDQLAARREVRVHHHHQEGVQLLHREQYFLLLILGIQVNHQ